MRRILGWLFVGGVTAAAAGCKDLTRFSTAPGESYCGGVLSAPFVRRRVGPDVRMRMTFDADRAADAPGALSTSDGLLVEAPLLPLPELAHDSLSTLSFGEGRDKNLLFAVDPNEGGHKAAILAVLSLLHDGRAEVRLLRGAPAGSGATGASSGGPFDGDEALFAVFTPLTREAGRCSF